ncbi:MAG: ABC transporter ATP-binding protein [Synergistaceae bacterium]|jgi:iron complex transport system ATP-binding protein|nr:ABC transporter ATP-binding protein [Synergistaceae bacterium]
MKDSGIKISGLSLKLNGKRILSDISFKVEQGEFFCVIGRNGAGKSTLLKCICGIMGGYEGEINIRGRRSAGMPARDRSRLVAYVPQGSRSDVPYTVRDFLELSRYPWRGVSSKTNDAREVAEAMDMTGTAAFADRRLSSLSGGERQKVMIASAIAQGTDAILMDEPTTYLDYAHQMETMDMMTRVNSLRGVSMIIVTHDINLAAELSGASGTVAAMSAGRIEWMGPPSGLFDADRLNGIFGVPFRRYRADTPGGRQILAPERTVL